MSAAEKGRLRGKRTAQAGKTSDRIRRVHGLLRRRYGRVKKPGTVPPLDSLIRTILSQNTSDKNSHEGFRRLKQRFPRWEDAAAAPVRSVAAAIRVSGLSNVKAPRIKSILRRIQSERRKLSLDFLKRMRPAEALEYLSSFDGVGPKTAACVLLFSCGKRVFPVDTHILRVSKRLGLIPQAANLEKAHELLGCAVPAPLMYEFHLLMIRHGRETCTARTPRCSACVLRRSCACPLPAKEG